jgi:hypothetical protein
LPRSIWFTRTDWKLRLAYFVPTDRQPIDDYARRIRVVFLPLILSFSSRGVISQRQRRVARQLD